MTAVSSVAAEELLHDLVAIASPSHEEAEAATFLVEWMRSQGYDEAYVDEVGNAVGIIGRGARDVILLGHIDTFAGFPPVQVEDHILYGRGSVDAKGPLCTFAVAARRAIARDDLRVVVVGAVEEEAATSKGARHIVANYQPDYCVIGEPSQWDRITLGYKGRLTCRLALGRWTDTQRRRGAKSRGTRGRLLAANPGLRRRKQSGYRLDLRQHGCVAS